MKTICFDIRCLQMGHESRGIGMHVKSMLEHLPERDDIEYTLYAFDTNDPVRLLGVKMQAPYRLIQTPAVKKSIDSPKDFAQLAKIIWHRYGPLRENPPDYFVQFDFMLGLPSFAKTTTALFAYDLIPLLFKEEYLPSVSSVLRNTNGSFTKAKRAFRALYYKWRYSLHYSNFHRADTIIAISHNTAESLHTLLNVNPAKVSVAHLAPVFSATEPQKPNGLTFSTEEPFIFYIGATDSRKRVQDLVKAFELAQNQNAPLQLVLAGKEFRDVKKIPNETIRDSIIHSPHKDAIHTLGYVTNEEKLWLYQNALAFVYPTAYEGFGLPIAEAMQQRCVAISYDNSSIPEVAGDAALLVPTGDVEQLSSTIMRTINDPMLQQDLQERGFQQSAQFTWPAHVRKLFTALELSSKEAG